MPFGTGSYEDPAALRVYFSYDGKLGDFPRLTKVEQSTPTLAQRYVFEIDSLSLEAPPESAFMLPAYGLPDLKDTPQTLAKPKVPIWIWAVVVATFCSGIFLKLQSRRLKANRA